jgi:hypothetical protein
MLPYLAATLTVVLIGNHLFEEHIILATPVNGAYKIDRILHHEDPNEIPIFGNSRAEAHFVPAIIHPNSFNYGLSGTHADVWMFFLQQELKKSRQTPILLNIDLEGLDSAIGNPSNYILNADHPEVQALMGRHYSWAYRIPLLKYFNQFDLFMGLWMNNRSKPVAGGERGALLHHKPVDSATRAISFIRRAEGENSFDGSPTMESELFALLAAHPGRHVIFVVSPYHASIFKHFTNLDEAHDLLSRLDALPNADVIDLSHVDYPDSLYDNSTHLASVGAVRFSQELRDSLHARIGAPF